MSLIQYRRDLHRIPELGFDLPLTLDYVCGRLEQLTGRVFSPAPSSLCIYFDAGAPTTLAFRADMDGLPVEEVSEADYRSSHRGQMHACGHDGHMAMLLAFCEYVSQAKDLRHNVLAIFQPAEETSGGALPICESGVLQEYRVDAVFGIHMWPGFEAGRIVSRRGELMARCSEVHIDITGKGVHVAKADQGADALLAAALMASRVYEFEASLPADQLRLLKFGLMKAGTVGNVIAGRAQLAGTMRAFNDDVYDALRASVLDIARSVEADTGCRVEVDVYAGYPPVINDIDLMDRVVAQTGLELTLLDEPPMTGEDFSFYQQQAPGVFFFLGTGRDAALHTSDFDMDESALASGLDLYKSLLEVEL